MSQPIVVDIISNSLTIWNYQQANQIYEMGYFGKPLGVRKATPGQEINRPLSLSLFDGLYLLEMGVVQIRKGRLLSKEEYIQYADEHFEDFKDKYVIYKEFRDKGYVVRPGMKFGTDFIIYEKGPGIDHSKYAVLVEKDDSQLSAINIVRAGRLAHSVKKTFLIATKMGDAHRYFSFTRFKL
ncbi:MAG: tRNA-intron lyase [Candidatus Heimdallarchaeota archaeon]|nr:tRNA-intron lyase [Candidatus Heimdallarchaeota archaeon]